MNATIDRERTFLRSLLPNGNRGDVWLITRAQAKRVAKPNPIGPATQKLTISLEDFVIIISAIPAWLLPAIAGVVAVVGTVLDMGRNLRDLLDIGLRFLRGFKATGAVAASSAWAGLGAGGGIIGGGAGTLRPGPGVGNNGGTLGGAGTGAVIGVAMTLQQLLAHIELTEFTELVRNRLPHRKFFPAAIVNRRMMILPIPIINVATAAITMTGLGHYGGVYTLLGVNAEEVARIAGGGRPPSLEPRIPVGHFPHFHPFNRTPKGHAWFGIPNGGWR